MSTWGLGRGAFCPPVREMKVRSISADEQRGTGTGLQPSGCRTWPGFVYGELPDSPPGGGFWFENGGFVTRADAHGPVMECVYHANVRNWQPGSAQRLGRTQLSSERSSITSSALQPIKSSGCLFVVDFKKTWTIKSLWPRLSYSSRLWHLCTYPCAFHHMKIPPPMGLYWIVYLQACLVIRRRGSSREFRNERSCNVLSIMSLFEPTKKRDTLHSQLWWLVKVSESRTEYDSYAPLRSLILP